MQELNLAAPLISGPRLALKIDVDTWRGTRLGVPALANLLQQLNVGATFLFSLGPDHTGRAIKRVFRPGFVKKVQRTSVLEHYGLKTLLYGTLLPGPDIGKRGASIMRAVRAQGFEVGIHCWDHVAWQDGVAHFDATTTERHMQRAQQRFTEIFGEPARVHGAAGWQMNRHAMRLTQRMGFAYCSDGRGESPFLPVVNGELIDCPQLPTTLPTLDELIGLDGRTADNVHEHLLALTQPADSTTRNHVFTLHAELEGMKLAHVLERLIKGWQAQGYHVCSLADYAASLPAHALPRHEALAGEIPGRSGTLQIQGPAFLA